MNLNVIYATPVAQFNASQFIDYANSLFDTVNLIEVPSGLFLSSLDRHNGVKYETLPNSEPLKDFIVDCTKEFCLAMGGEADKYDFEVTNIWLNEMKSGTFHPMHNHWGRAFSGTFYVNMPSNTSGITFLTPLNLINRFKMSVKEHTPFNANAMTFQPPTGDLLIWESHTLHEVPYAEYEGIRRCIAFDVDLKERNT